MIVCRSCGGHNADTDDFCGSCGEFLEWTGEKLAPESAQSPAPQPPPSAVLQSTSSAPESTWAAPQPTVAVPPAPPATLKPPPPKLPPDPPPPTSSAAQSTGPEPRPAEPKPAVTGFSPAVGGFSPVGEFAPAVGGRSPAGTPSKPAGAEVNPPRPAVTEPPLRAVQALVAPQVPTAPGPTLPARPAPGPGPAARKPQPQEMRPQAPVRKRPTAPPTPSPPTRQPQPDDLICGMCGEGNPPTRRFCSRCGESLQTATVVPTPWWRQVLKVFERRRHPAGTRPKRRPSLLTLRGVSSMIRRVLLMALVLAGLSYAVFPSMRGSVNQLIRGGLTGIESSLGQDPVQVRPIKVTATDEVPENPAALASDRFTNTFWVASDARARPKLVVQFEHPTNLVSAIVHNGGGEDFQALARPWDLHLVYADGDRIIGASDVSLNDIPGEQRVTLRNGAGATRVEIQVMSVHGAPNNNAMALSEIEFFERP